MKKQLLSLLMVLSLLCGVFPVLALSAGLDAMETAPVIASTDELHSAENVSPADEPSASSTAEPDGETAEPLEATASGTCGDNLTWTLDIEGTLVISGSGQMIDYYSYSLPPWSDYLDKIEKVVVEQGITYIGSMSFHSCKNLRNASVADSVTGIGAFAFAFCNNLEGFQIPPNVNSIGMAAFEECFRLTEIVIPEGVTTLPTYSFYYCSGLKTLKLPDSLLSIEKLAFGDCNALEKIEFGTNLTGIGTYAFYGCGELTSVEIPDSVTAIGDYAFNYCGKLSAVTIGNNVASIGSYAFYYCTNLENVTFGASVASIGNYAFSRTNLSEVILPNRTVSISSTAFPEGTVITYADDTNSTETSPLSSTGNTNFVQSNNIHDQNYYIVASIINSYLFEGEDQTLYRVVYNGEQLMMEKFDRNYCFQDSWEIPMELPIFGGFYAGSDAYYVVFGQSNFSESDGTEVIRVVKYDKNLVRQGAAGVYGANTIGTFASSSLRMDEGDQYLYIHTGHTMYDGHQGTLEIKVDKDSMFATVISDGTQWDDIIYGYVSHSFNQFIKTYKTDYGTLYATIDHGDGSPRGIALNTSLNIFPFFGEEEYDGLNYTGASIGGFELSNTNYLVAFNTIDQDNFTIGSSNISDETVRNVMLSVASRTDYTSVQTVKVTDYSAGGEISASTPQLVKLSDTLFVVMWEEQVRVTPVTRSYFTSNYTNGKVKLAFFDGEGNQIGKIQSMSGSLSDCQPVVINGRVIWYVTDGESLQWYSFSADGITAVQTDTNSAFVLDPYDLLSDCGQVFAASYNDSGRMTGIASGTIGYNNTDEGWTVTFSRELDVNWKLYFVQQDTFIPLGPSITLTKNS